MSEMLKLMTCGSRSVSDKELVFSELDKFRKKNPSLALISGGAKGADTIAEEWAKARGVPITQYKPDWKKYGRGAGIVRNKKMVLAADFVIAFWDGASKGTKFVIDFCAKSGKVCRVIRIGACGG